MEWSLSVSGFSKVPSFSPGVPLLADQSSTRYVTGFPSGLPRKNANRTPVTVYPCGLFPVVNCCARSSEKGNRFTPPPVIVLLTRTIGSGSSAEISPQPETTLAINKPAARARIRRFIKASPACIAACVSDAHH